MSAPARFKTGDKVRVVTGDPSYGLETGSIWTVDTANHNGSLVRLETLTRAGAVRFGAWRFEKALDVPGN